MPKSKAKTGVSVIGILVAAILTWFFTDQNQSTTNGGANAANNQTTSAPAANGTSSRDATANQSRRSDVGFTSKRGLQSHFEKHGREFGNIDAGEYLRLAQALRDAALSDDVIEIVRKDGVITRFDKRSGGFLAFHKDKTIRTFFRPNDGEAYFRRQAKR